MAEEALSKNGALLNGAQCTETKWFPAEPMTNIELTQMITDTTPHAEGTHHSRIPAVESLSEMTAGPISDSDIFRHYYNAYQEALNLHKTCQIGAAEDKCRELEFDFECPRLIQVQACQLGSRCSMSYWSRKAHLEHGIFLLRSMNAMDQVVIRMRQEIEATLAELEEDWRAHWAMRGLPAPTEEHDVWEDVMEDEEGAQADAEDDDEQHDVKLQDLALR